MDTPVELASVLSAPPPLEQGETIEEWGVFNDPAVLGPRFDSGEIHPQLREELLETPLWTSPIAGAAKRYQEYHNRQRAESGNFLKEGWLILRTRTITRSGWRKIEKDEWDEIDNGKRANG